MLIKKTTPSDENESQVTDESVFVNRRKLLKQMGFVGIGALTSAQAGAGVLDWFAKPKVDAFKTLALNYAKDRQNSAQQLTDEIKATTHNNFYEFGTDKAAPAAKSQQFKVNPWHLRIDGLVKKPFTLDYDQLLSAFPLEERIYRLRCVEAWSMVIPWIGFSLASLLKKAEPTASAKYVAFETVYDPEQMPGQANRFVGGGISYPYTEGLRIDEAMNPLSFMAVGMYGKTLPPQNGAPIRLVVPWKYGFKSIKSVVSIKLVESKPPTTWNILAPDEYGFYANVNPAVDHPRWSQASERRITQGGLFNQDRIATLPFNGYGDQVAHLYKTMDLSKHY